MAMLELFSDFFSKRVWVITTGAASGAFAVSAEIFAVYPMSGCFVHEGKLRSAALMAAECPNVPTKISVG
jgi:hypothetical protein